MDLRSVATGDKGVDFYTIAERWRKDGAQAV
jgi:hypothetical protein